MYNRAYLKQEVKQTIASTRPRPMWIALLYLVIASIGASLIQIVIGSVAGTSFLTGKLSELLMSGYDLEEAFSEFVLLYADQLMTFVGTMTAASLLSSVLDTLWQGLMTVGFNGYCLSLVRGENPTVGRIFCGFPLFGKVILTSLLVWVFMNLWMLLWTVCLLVVIFIAALFMEAAPAVGVILMILGYVGFFIMVVRVALRYAMTNYILLDTGKYGLEAITESKQMMKGNKGKLFMLGLSFVGWYLLAFAIAMVGLIICVLIAAGATALSAGGDASFGAIAGLVGGGMLLFVLMYAVIWLLNIWLQPYITGSVAKFYLFFRPQPPVEQVSWPTLGDTTTTISDDTMNTEY